MGGGLNESLMTFWRMDGCSHRDGLGTHGHANEFEK
jgi:hypothetical protein